MNIEIFLELSIPNYPSIIHLLKLTGVETLFAPFHFELTLLPESMEDFNQLQLQDEVSFAIHHHSQQTAQWFNGIIESIEYADSNPNNPRIIKLTIVPKISLMQTKQRCRNFVNATVKDILKQLCQEHKIFDVDFRQLAGTYPELPYCVQYEESDLDFLHRFCSHQGIYYYFKHSQEKHTLIFSDHPLPALTYSELLIHRNTHSAETAYLYHWTRSQKTYIPSMQNQSFNLLNPHYPFQAGNHTRQLQPKIPVGNMEYKQHDESGFLKTAAELSAKLKIQHEAQLLQQQQIQCEGNYPSLSAGMQINITSTVDPQINGAYYLYQVQHTANAATDNSIQTYRNALSLYPQSLSFVPLPLPLQENVAVPGVISAVVMGPEGSEAYSNAFAEIKVQPEWGDTSTWVRVKQTFAGNGFGSQFIPRMSQSVILSHQQGQPHKPSVIGSIYTPLQPPIYNTRTQSGFKTHSLAGAITEGHQLQFDDTPQQEQLFLKSQRDKEVLVNGTHQRFVENNNHTHIQQGDYQVKVQNEYSLIAKHKLHLHVGTSEIILDADGVHFHADNIYLTSAQKTQ